MVKEKLSWIRLAKTPSSTMAHYQFHSLRSKSHGCRRYIWAHEKGCGHPRAACWTSCMALDFNLQKRSYGRVKQFVPSSKGTSPWLSNKQEFHHDDLYDCQPSERGTKQWLTHSKRRGAEIVDSSLVLTSEYLRTWTFLIRAFNVAKLDKDTFNLGVLIKSIDTVFTANTWLFITSYWHLRRRCPPSIDEANSRF